MWNFSVKAAFILKTCDHSVEIFQIIGICLEYLVYDPNYNYDDEQSEESMDLDDEEEDGGLVFF